MEEIQTIFGFFFCKDPQSFVPRKSIEDTVPAEEAEEELAKGRAIAFDEDDIIVEEEREPASTTGGACEEISTVAGFITCQDPEDEFGGPVCQEIQTVGEFVVCKDPVGQDKAIMIVKKEDNTRAPAEVFNANTVEEAAVNLHTAEVVQPKTQDDANADTPELVATEEEKTMIVSANPVEVACPEEVSTNQRVMIKVVKQKDKTFAPQVVDETRPDPVVASQ